jgi:hypothetical protein
VDTNLYRYLLGAPMDGSLVTPSDRQTFWIGMALGPACWFGNLVSSYALQPLACVHAPWLLPGVAVCFTVPLILSTIVAGRGLRGLSAKPARQCFMALFGALMPAIFLITLLWSALASLVFSPCE